MYNIQNNCIAWIHILFLIILINKGSTKACVNKNATQDSQYIYSHSGFNSVEKYPSNTDECWVIHADPAMFGPHVRVQLTMMYFDLEDSDNCTLDYVEIYSGDNPDSGSEIIGTYCGYEDSISVVSNSSHMYVKFISDIGKELAGFKIKYKATLVKSNGITSPVSVNGCYYLEAEAVTQTIYSHEGYPTENYPSRYDACWIIHVSPDVPQPIFFWATLGVKLWTTDFSVENDANCALDYVSVYNGDNNVSTQLLTKLCGDTAFVEYAENFMFVQFHSDKSQAFSGFSLKYTTVFMDQDKNILQLPIDSCTYLKATDEKQYFTSHPEYGKTNYDWTDDACWIIAVATNRSNDVVQVTSIDFHLESSTRGCRHDYLSFYDGFYSYNSETMGRYCNNSFHNQASTGKYMTIIFTVDCCVDFTGFELEYFAVDAGLPDRRNHFPSVFAGWKIALIVISAIIGLIILVGIFVLLVYMDDIIEWWPTRSICRCNCGKKKDSEADTEADEVEGACAMNVIPSTTTVTDTPTSNTGFNREHNPRYKKKKAIISADRYRTSDSSSEEGDRPPKKLKKKRRQEVQDTSEINVTIDPPPYATDIEDDPPPPYPTAPCHI